MIIKKSEIALVGQDSSILKQPAVPFDFEDTDATMLSNIMFEKMEGWGGIALAAPQIGLSTSIFVMGKGEVKIEIINPKILYYSSEIVTMEESSLTFPFVKVNISRPISIEVKFETKTGEVVQQEFKGITARIFQHCYDHLQGITIKDKSSKLKWDMATKRLNNYKQKLVKKYTQKKLLEIKNSMEEQTNGNT